MHVTNTNNYLHKIGFASDVRRRRQELSDEFDTPLVVIGSVAVDDDVEVEAWFHRLFEQERIDGELFLLDDRQVTLWLALADVIGRSRGRILTSR